MHRLLDDPPADADAVLSHRRRERDSDNIVDQLELGAPDDIHHVRTLAISALIVSVLALIGAVAGAVLTFRRGASSRTS